MTPAKEQKLKPRKGSKPKGTGRAAGEPRSSRDRGDGSGGGTFTDVVIGRNPVREALRAGQPIERIYVTSAEGQAGSGDESRSAGGPGSRPGTGREFGPETGRGTSSGPRHGLVAALVEEARRRGILVQETDRRHLDRLAEGRVHQGVVAVAAPVPYASLEDVLARAKAQGEDPLLLMLNEVQDPHNLGSLLRSADGAGVHGVLIPRRRAAGLTMTVARTSAGAVYHVPVVQVANVAQTLAQLKDRGVWVVGADTTEAQNYWDAPLTGPLVLVVGGEDRGLGRVVRKACDIIVRIPTTGQVNSLNAGVAGALILFEIARQRRTGR